jgi:predicted transposase/invertase (TIGR01784 family)
MTQVSTPHDEFFKRVFSQQDAAHSFVANYLPPEINALFDLEGLRIDKDSFVDDELMSHHSDILYSVALRDGGEGYVYVLFEHKSYPDRRVAFQLLRYIVRIWERQRERKEELRPVFPIVVYHGKRKWNYPLDFASLVTGLPEEMRPYVPDYSYQLCDLSQYSDEVIIGTVYLQMALLLLKYASSDEFYDKLSGIMELFESLLESDRRTALSFFESMLRYVSGARDESDAEVRRAIEEAFPAGGELMETILERWAERGFQRGLEQGVQQGLERGVQQGLERGVQQGLERGVQQGKQEGVREGLLVGIKLALKLRFGSEGLRLLPEIYKIEDVDVLRAIHEGLEMVNTLDELTLIYRPGGDDGD